jgi:hypothetical protein
MEITGPHTATTGARAVRDCGAVFGQVGHLVPTREMSLLFVMLAVAHAGGDDHHHSSGTVTAPSSAPPCEPRTAAAAPNLLVGGVPSFSFVHKSAKLNDAKDAIIMSGTGLQDNFPEAVGPAIAVTPGKRYTASMDMTAAEFPSNQVMLFLTVTNTSGGERKGASAGTRWAVSAANRTEECTIFFTAEEGDAHASIVFALYNYGNDTGPSTGVVLLSNPYFGEGNTVREPASPKRAFNAITDPVHIAADGTWYVNGEPYFMKAMYVGNTRKDYASLVNAGWNTNMWASVAGTVALGKKAGMRSMIQLAEYGLTGFWGSGNISTVLGRLDKAWSDIVAAGVDDYAIGWYWDNENRCVVSVLWPSVLVELSVRFLER